MLDPDFRQKAEDAEAMAPKRLTRRDVAEIRGLFEEAQQAYPDERWRAQRTLWLVRDRGARAAARLGRPTAGVVLAVAWSLKSEHGLDLVATAHAAIGSPHNLKMRVGTHRFRPTTPAAQFAREAAHLVRLGLGWAANQRARLIHILD